MSEIPDAMQVAMPPDVFDALAHPVRRRLLMELRTGPRSASELAADMPIGRPAVSEHLAVLRSAGLVRVEKRGRERHHHFDPRPLAEVGGWLNLMLAHWARRMEEIERLERSPESPAVVVASEAPPSLRAKRSNPFPP